MNKDERLERYSYMNGLENMGFRSHFFDIIFNLLRNYIPEYKTIENQVRP